MPLFQAALARQKAAVECALARLPDGLSADDLHDVRVALRRTSALAQLSRGVPEKGDGAALHEAARALRRVLSRSRTSEVSRALLEKRARRSRAHAPLLRRLIRALGAAAERPGRRRLARQVARLRFAFARRTAQLNPFGSRASFGPRAPLEEALRARAEKRLATRRRNLLDIGAPKPEQVHAMRIAAKQLRYELEPLQAHVADARALLDALKEFQDLAGDAHDRVELRDAVERSAAALPPREARAAADLVAALSREAARALARAEEAAPKLLGIVRRARLRLPR